MTSSACPGAATLFRWTLSPIQSATNRLPSASTPAASGPRQLDVHGGVTASHRELLPSLSRTRITSYRGVDPAGASSMAVHAESFAIIQPFPWRSVILLRTPLF